MTSSEARTTPEGTEAPRAVVVAHGDLAAGLVSAVEQISGRGAVFVPLSNRGLGPAELEALVEPWIARGVQVVFTDLPAGSTTLCARRLQRAHTELVVVTGTSLSALLAFALATDQPAAEAARIAAEKGRGALQVVSATPTPATPTTPAPSAPSPAAGG